MNDLHVLAGVLAWAAGQHAKLLLQLARQALHVDILEGVLDAGVGQQDWQQVLDDFLYAFLAAECAKGGVAIGACPVNRAGGSSGGSCG